MKAPTYRGIMAQLKQESSQMPSGSPPPSGSASFSAGKYPCPVNQSSAMTASASSRVTFCSRAKRSRASSIAGVKVHRVSCGKVVLRVWDDPRQSFTTKSLIFKTKQLPENSVVLSEELEFKIRRSASVRHFSSLTSSNDPAPMRGCSTEEEDIFYLGARYLSSSGISFAILVRSSITSLDESASSILSIKNWLRL